MRDLTAIRLLLFPIRTHDIDTFLASLFPYTRQCREEIAWQFFLS